MEYKEPILEPPTVKLDDLLNVVPGHTYVLISNTYRWGDYRYGMSVVVREIRFKPDHPPFSRVLLVNGHGYGYVALQDLITQETFNQIQANTRIPVGSLTLRHIGGTITVETTNNVNAIITIKDYDIDPKDIADPTKVLNDPALGNYVERLLKA